MLNLLLVTVGALLLGLALKVALDRKLPWPKRAAGFIALVPLGGLALVFGGLRTWLQAGASPAPESYTVANGISFARKVPRLPTPTAWHVVRVDLSTPGLRFVMSPGTGEAARQASTKKLPYQAESTSEFLVRNKLDVAINASSFEPRLGAGAFTEPVLPGAALRALGVTAAHGVVLSGAQADGKVTPSDATLFISETNQVSIGAPAPTTVHHAITGDCVLVSVGAVATNLGGCALAGERHPRTAVGFDRAKRVMWLFVVDGYRPGASDGATLAELAQVAVDEGVDVAINLDGGGSSTMALRTRTGDRAVVNTPVTGGVPGLERAVANHLGIVSDIRIAGY
jgi:Phosphodiester glycosidase